MPNNPLAAKTIDQKTSAPDIEGTVLRALYFNTILEDTRHYAHVKMAALQETLADLSMHLDPTLLSTVNANKIPQVLTQVRALLHKTSTDLNYCRYNLYAVPLKPKTFVVCDIGELIKLALADKPPTKNCSVEWINAHNFYFYGNEKVSQAIIANILDIGHQAACQHGQGAVKLWTGQHRSYNQLHIQFDLQLNLHRQDDKRWLSVAPQTSFRLLLALCRKVMTVSGGNVYLIPQAQGTHFVLSFPKIEHKKQAKA
ncbi:MAG: hypothetical protein V3V61_05375 [Gammaproteobacteria bacterium]